MKLDEDRGHVESDGCHGLSFGESFGEGGDVGAITLTSVEKGFFVGPAPRSGDTCRFLPRVVTGLFTSALARPHPDGVAVPKAKREEDFFPVRVAYLYFISLYKNMDKNEQCISSTCKKNMRTGRVNST